MSCVSSAMSAPLSCSCWSIASRSRTRKLSMVRWAREPKYSVSDANVANTVAPGSWCHTPWSSSFSPRQSWYQAARASGSAARRKYPPIPSTRSISPWCDQVLHHGYLPVEPPFVAGGSARDELGREQHLLVHVIRRGGLVDEQLGGGPAEVPAGLAH